MLGAETVQGGGSVDREFLGRIPIFAGLPAQALDWIVGAGAVVAAAAGSELITEGEAPSSVFVVLEGELEIRKRGARGAEVQLAVLRAGDCVGEMSLIDIQPRSASVRALTPSSLFRLNLKEIAQLHRTLPEVYTFLVMNIAREISRRLRRADQVLADLGVVARGTQEMWSHVDGASER